MVKRNVQDGVMRYEDCKELVERCLGYFHERLIDGGSDEWAEIEYLEDTMGLSDEELKDVFKRLGYCD